MKSARIGDAVASSITFAVVLIQAPNLQFLSPHSREGSRAWVSAVCAFIVRCRHSDNMYHLYSLEYLRGAISLKQHFAKTTLATTKKVYIQFLNTRVCAMKPIV